MPVKSRIVAFAQDSHGHWLAHLACGHQRPVRHRPPWQNHPWVLSPSGREQHLGTPIHCRDCTAAGPPENAVEVRRTRTFSEHDIPATLRERHVIPQGHWAGVHVLRGKLVCRQAGPPAQETEVEPGVPVFIGPGQAHTLAPAGPVRFYMTLVRAPTDAPES